VASVKHRFTSEELNPLFSAVGAIVVQWGQAEQTLDMIVAMIYHSYGGKAVGKRIPQPLNQKLKFVRKCAETINELRSHRQHIEKLAFDFEQLSSRRHELVHGAVASFNDSEGTFKFVKFDLINNFHHVRDFDLDMNEFPLLLDDLIKLGSDSLQVAGLLIQKLRNES